MPICRLKVAQDLTDDTLLWRYVDLAKFVSLLEKKALWLARSDTFKDKHEGRFPSEMRSSLSKIYRELPTEPGSKIEGPEDFQDYLSRNAYISCWHKNSVENMVMWEIYGRETNAVALQTTIGSLKKSLKVNPIEVSECYIGNVIYADQDQVTGPFNYKTPFFLKRPHFHFEQEVRVYASSYSVTNPSKDTPYGIELELKLSDAIEKVLVHPDSLDWFQSVVESLLTKYGLSVSMERGVCGNKF